MAFSNLARSLMPLKFRQTQEWTAGKIIGLCSVLVVGAVVLTTYYPAFKIGFWTDDFGFLELAGRLSWLGYLTFYFDPRVQTSWYRPMQGMQWRFEYLLFRGDPTGYHVVQVLFHFGNCLLLYAIVTKVTRTRWIGLVAALAYAALPIYSIAIMWLAVTDALAAFFCLLTIWLWLDYLEKGGALRYTLTFLAFVATLFSKEVTAPLPFVLFLMDRWLVAKPSAAQSVIRRNAPFFLFLPVYALLESNAILHGVFPKNMGYTPGLHSVSVFLQFLLQMVFPSETESLINYVGLAILAVVLARAVYKRNYRVLFLAATVFFVLLPLLPFHAVIVRYLYIPLMLSGVAFALACNWLFEWLKPTRWADRLFPVVLSLVIVFLVLGSSSITAERAENFAGTVRQTNSYFRPFFQQHPALPADTLLYIVDPPFVTYNVSGLMFLRYGSNVSVAGVETKSEAGLRDHALAYVLYSDDKGTVQSQRADKGAAVRVMPVLPARFQNSIYLDGVEPVATHVKLGADLILLLYWRGTAPIGEDYTVFAHLVDGDGKLVAGHDSQPQRGRRPTLTWGLEEPIADAIILTVPPDAPIGDDYRLEIGLYDPRTMKRLSVVDAHGEPISDKITVEPFDLVP